MSAPAGKDGAVKRRQVVGPMELRKGVLNASDAGAGNRMDKRRCPACGHSPRDKPIEFSKLLLACAGVMAGAVIVFSCAIMWHTMDTSGLAYLIPAVFAELAVGTGFYYKKAERENEIKLRAIFKEEDEYAG